MQSKKLEDITLADVQALITDRIPEGKTLDYKADFYRLEGGTPEYVKSQHEELLKDISCFANTIGGDLIIGVEEAAGVASNVCGFETPNPDRLMLRISEIAQSGLEPRVAFTIKSIEHSPGRYVFVIRVPQSLSAPHRIVFRREFGQFWARNSAGSFRMDTGELRTAFTQSESINTRIRTFRNERVEAISKGQTPILLSGKSKLICHLIPMYSFSSRISLDPGSLQHHLVNLPLMHFSGGWSHHYNIDGFLVTDSATGLDCSGYVQVFRNGIIESVVDDVVFYLDEDTGKQYPFFKTDYVRMILTYFPNYLQTMNSLGIQPPVWCFFTLTGVRGVNIFASHAAIHVGRPIDRDLLYIPEVMINDFSTGDVDDLLRPMFDAIWNSAGYPRCPQFDESSKYIGPGR